MDKILKEFKNNFELYLGSIFMIVTSVLVIMNVFTRYFLKFTYFWAEEIAVGAFVWVIFLGLANSYRTNSLIGVEVLVNLLPRKGRKVLDFITSLIIAVIAIAMLYFSFIYVIGSKKITAALEVSYAYINSSIVLSFALITIYSLINTVKSFAKILVKDDGAYDSEGGM